MSGKKTSSDTGSSKVVTIGPDDQKGTLKHIGGSQSDNWNHVLVNQTANAPWLKNADPETRDKQIKATVAGLIGIAPQDELEGMLAAQLVAAHNVTMDCLGRAMIPEQTFEGRRENLNQANKLSRTFTMLLEALNRHRGKGQQKVTVEHVHVHSGGQAIVGHVEQSPGGGSKRSKGKASAKHIEHAPEPPLRSADQEREPVPVRRDAERPLPHARRG